MKYSSNINIFARTILSIVLAMLLTSCMAVNWAIPQKDTVKGLTDVMNGVRGTFIFENKSSNIFVLGWSLAKQGGAYAFVLMDRNGVFTSVNDLPRATGTQWKSTVDFLLFLEKNGWKSVGPVALTPAIRLSILHAMTYTAYNMTSPIVLLVPPSLINQDIFEMLKKANNQQPVY